MGISLDKLLNDLNREQEEVAKIGITLDLGVRMAIIAFGKTVEPNDVAPIFASIKEGLFKEKLYAEHRSTLEPYIKDVEQRVLELSKKTFDK